MPYDHQAIEKKWQKKWEEEHAFEAEDQSDKEKFFALIEFPYPSGAGLHVGHPRPYTALDVIARKRRAQGYNVLYPIGWDAFGLPTENYAIKTGRPPEEVTAENIATFKRQIKSLGISFDWSREINTTDPAYYKWTQWIFLQFFKHGLAYKKAMPINWCLSCKIGLANEEVVNGACERCGGQVEKREKSQWMLAITKYADSLLEGLKEVDYIPQAKRQQENWIGKSEGALVRFDIQNESGEIIHESLEVFTTRPDTLFGVTYIVIAPEHPLTQSLEVQNKEEIKVYQEQAKNKTFIERSDVAKEKTGIEIKGLRAINLVNQESLPIFVADYVMMDYGTGAIMAVPAHDERDFEFAQKYHLPIRQVVAPHFIDPDNIPHKDKPVCRRKTVHVIIRHPKEDKILLLNWFFNITPSRPYLHTLIIGGVEEGEDLAQAAIREAQEETGYKHFRFIKELGLEIHTEYYAEHKDENRYAEIKVVVLQLEDEEQEMIAQEEMRKHELIWVDAKDVEESLNVVDGPLILNLYKKGFYSFCESGIAIHSNFLNSLSTEEAKEKMILFLEEKGLGKRQTQYKLRDWVFSRQRYWGEPIPLVYCENCANKKIFKSKGEEQNPGWIPLEEKELPLKLPQVNKYEPTDTGESPLSKIDEWVNVSCPRCGGIAKRETDTMPNWAGSSWYFLRYTDPQNQEVFAGKEKLAHWTPVDWYNGGMEHTVLHLLYSRFWNQFLFDIGLVPTKEPYKKRTSHGMILAKGGEKMSKSKGNVVNPDEIVSQYGADTMRTYLMFMGAFDAAVQWDPEAIVGVRRFLEKILNLQEILKEQESEKFTRALHKTIKKVTEDIETMKFNTAIAQMMSLVNQAQEEQQISKTSYEKLLQLLVPFAPHLCEEIWQKLGHYESIDQTSWPIYEKDWIKDEQIIIAIQINGKLRGTIEVEQRISEEKIKELAIQQENIKRYLDGKKIQKTFYVPGKLLSIVVL